MSRGLTFRTSTAFMVAGYALLAFLLVFGLGHDLMRPVPNLAPQVSWLMSETTDVRVAALRASGRPEIGALYALLAAVSWSMIAALAAGGFAWGVLNKGATVIGVDRAMNYLTAIAGLYGLSTVIELGLHALPAAIREQGGLHAIPGLWFFAMVPSAAILARVGALIFHDVGALVAIAIDGDRDRIAEVVRSAEERRGPNSMEARLARRMAAVRLAE